MVDAINALVDTLQSSALATAPQKQSTVTGGGLVNTQWTVDNTSTTNQLTATDARTYSKTSSSTFFAPTSVSYTIPIITISGSQVSETGNTSTAQPTTYTSTTKQEATSIPTTDINPSAKAGSEGLDLAAVAVPVAVIAGVAILGTSLIGAVFD